MPDAAGNIKGSGWSRARADAWDRVFGNPATQQREWGRNAVNKHAEALRLLSVPRESSPEVPPDCNGCGEDGHVIDDCPEHP